MSYKPTDFEANIEKIFAAADESKIVKTWVRKGKFVKNPTLPEIQIEVISGSIESLSLSSPHSKIDFYVRFVIFDTYGTNNSQIDSIFDLIIKTVAANPYLQNEKGEATCEYFGTFDGRRISFESAATERNGHIVHAMKIDVPCQTFRK